MMPSNYRTHLLTTVDFPRGYCSIEKDKRQWGCTCNQCRTMHTDESYPQSNGLRKLAARPRSGQTCTKSQRISGPSFDKKWRENLTRGRMSMDRWPGVNV